MLTSTVMRLSIAGQCATGEESLNDARLSGDQAAWKQQAHAAA
jgi:hypothetical protein